MGRDQQITSLEDEVLAREIANNQKRRGIKEQKKLYGDLSRLKRVSEKNLMSIQEEEEKLKSIAERKVKEMERQLQAKDVEIQRLKRFVDTMEQSQQSEQ